jgi:hypothetical protein
MRKPPRSAYIAERDKTRNRSNISDGGGVIEGKGLTRLGGAARSANFKPVVLNWCYNEYHTSEIDGPPVDLSPVQKGYKK